MLPHRAARDLETLVRAVSGDHERDRAEPFLEVLRIILGIELDDERRAYARVLELRMNDRLAVDQDRPEAPRSFDPLGHPVVHHRTENLHRARGISDELLHGLAERLRHLIER